MNTVIDIEISRTRLEGAQPKVLSFSVNDLIKEFSAQDHFAEHLATSRKELVSKFYGDDGDTIKTRRLKNGWSQQELAEKLGTSQSHLARIENKGSSQLWLSTCRKLCEVLSVDMNTLNEMLERQEQLSIAINNGTK